MTDEAVPDLSDEERDRLKEILRQATLVEVTMFASQGERTDITGGVIPDGNEDDEVSISVRHGSRPGGLVVQVEAALEAAQATCRVVFGAHYEVEDDIEVSDLTPAMMEVILNRLVLIQVWPYLRQELHTLTARLGVEPVLLPLFRPGSALAEMVSDGADA